MGSKFVGYLEKRCGNEDKIGGVEILVKNDLFKNVAEKNRISDKVMIW